MTCEGVSVASALLVNGLAQLAEAAGLGLSTVYEFESERREVAEASLAKMRRALEKAGVEFTNGKRPGVRLAR
jgi:transcriptional regulator with XRE-family HTH domain